MLGSDLSEMTRSKGVLVFWGLATECALFNLQQEEGHGQPCLRENMQNFSL